MLIFTAMHTAFFEGIITAQTIIELNEDESFHLCKVARITVNEVILIINGEGQLAVGKIFSIHQKKTTIEITSVTNYQPSQKKLHLAIAPTKSADRMEWLLEKATELGLYEFTPIITARTEKKKVNTERLNKIALSACKQSKNPFLPKINEPVSLKDFIKTTLTKSANKFIAYCDETENNQLLKEIAQSNLEACLLVGPEGDFTKGEIAEATNRGFVAVKLTSTTLRTETAGLYACSLWA